MVLMSSQLSTNFLPFRRLSSITHAPGFSNSQESRLPFPFLPVYPDIKKCQFLPHPGKA